MRRVPSSEFRVTYARLTEPVDVTVLDRVIGRWLPATTIVETSTEPVRQLSIAPPTRQADRDAVLRRINRGAAR